MRFLVDSDRIIDALAVAPGARELLDELSDDGLAVSINSLGELVEGTYRAADPEAAQRTVRAFLEGDTVLNLSDEIITEFARLRAFLRRHGQGIPDLDLLIAATALTHDLTLLTRNLRDFEHIPDLKLYRPA